MGPGPSGSRAQVGPGPSGPRAQVGPGPSGPGPKWARGQVGPGPSGPGAQVGPGPKRGLRQRFLIFIFGTKSGRESRTAVMASSFTPSPRQRKEDPHKAVACQCMPYIPYIPYIPYMAYTWPCRKRCDAMAMALGALGDAHRLSSPGGARR